MQKNFYWLLVLFLTFGICGADLAASEFTKGKMWSCRKCRMISVNEKQPKVANCKRKGNHQWFLLGEVGEKIFRCRKCKMMLATKKQPNVINCFPSGNHQWYEMAKYGNKHFRCRKCELEVYANKQPKVEYCDKKGNHQWDML